MRWPRPRTSTQRALIAAAVAAGLIAAWDGILWMRQRQLDYQLRALDHAAAARVYGRDAAEATVLNCFADLPARDFARAVQHAALARKWTAAARSPWLPVAADPPGAE
jgi:hypothetical protein